ncbi:MAG: hypothetical protein U5N86_02965 [Planctomycetota bacterium]|nr:hypothetical protein [Planctomycetota bacterium]
MKLAAGLVKHRRSKGLFVLDEPTIGLHFEDMSRLLDLLGKLVAKGDTVVVVEHDPEFIACCDYVIELGPGGAEEGGKLVAQGSPARLVSEKTLTGRELGKLCQFVEER